MRFNFNFFMYSQKIDTPESQHGYFFLKEVKPSPDRKMMKLPTFDNLFLPLRHSSETHRKMTTASTFLIHKPTTDRENLILVVRRSRLRIKGLLYFLSHKRNTKELPENSMRYSIYVHRGKMHGNS